MKSKIYLFLVIFCIFGMLTCSTRVLNSEIHSTLTIPEVEEWRYYIAEHLRLGEPLTWFDEIESYIIMNELRMIYICGENDTIKIKVEYEGNNNE